MCTRLPLIANRCAHEAKQFEPSMRQQWGTHAVVQTEHAAKSCDMGGNGPEEARAPFSVIPLR